MSAPPHVPRRDDDALSAFNRKLKEVQMDPPETVLSSAVRIKGEMAFERLLRVEGLFEGTLRSSGSLVVGPTGMIVGPVLGMKAVIVDGRLQGDVSADKVFIGPNGCIEGNVVARRVICAEGAVLSGKWSVHRQVPNPLQLDDKGKLVKYEVEPEDGAAGSNEPQ